MLEYGYGVFPFLFVFNCIGNIRIGSDCPAQYPKECMLMKSHKMATDVTQENQSIYALT